MRDNGKPKESAGLLYKTSAALKNNAKLTKDGIAYYFDTLCKLPGAYMTTSDQVRSDNLRKRGIRSLASIESIKDRITENKDKARSIEEWVGMAKEGTWSAAVENNIESFSKTSIELKEKSELIEADYKHSVDLLLSHHEQEIVAAINNGKPTQGIDKKKQQIIKSLKQIELIGEQVDDYTSNISKVEKDIERFIDNDLPGLNKDSLKRSAGQSLKTQFSWIKGLFSVWCNSVNRLTKAIKFVVLGLYYVARIFIFIIKYFILLPAAFLERIFGRPNSIKTNKQ